MLFKRNRFLEGVVFIAWERKKTVDLLGILSCHTQLGYCRINPKHIQDEIEKYLFPSLVDGAIFLLMQNAESQID